VEEIVVSPATHVFRIGDRIIVRTGQDEAATGADQVQSLTDNRLRLYQVLEDLAHRNDVKGTTDGSQRMSDVQAAIFNAEGAIPLLVLPNSIRGEVHARNLSAGHALFYLAAQQTRTAGNIQDPAPTRD
jgi:hypothetical protein